jgi:dephospho-CoA kinase
MATEIESRASNLVVGLTGGIGVGKSTVCSLLAARGAEVVDVDALGRAVLEPDGGAYAEVVSTFGQTIVGPDGHIDRAALAEIVFGGGRLAELEAISHPAINARIEELVAAAPEGGVLVLDMAVLAESRLGYRGDAPLYRRVVVVEAPMEVRIPRLVERGLTESQARDRMSTQAGDDDRRMLADLIITNDGSVELLEERVDSLWPTFEAWSLQAASA